jgi:hypothetical protein
MEIASRDLGAGDRVYGIAASLPPGGRFDLTGEGAATTVSVEVDASWITSEGDDGLSIELLRVTGGDPQPFFGITVRGIGVRVGSGTGPLLDTFIGVDSIALHALASVGTTGVSDVGGQLELTGMTVSLGGADDSTNKVAGGVLRDATSGGQTPSPTFSPALAVQRHGGGPVSVDLRAGEGDGPWWVGIQRAFGPVYIEQIGFAVSRSGDTVIAARVLVDGKVSLLGLVIAVDDLSLGATWPQADADPPLYEPRAWQVDLAGLAVSAETGGVIISGGLRRSPGFAYVMWFTGPHAGEFVLTLGGYHPSFHRDGYPVVPRLGFVWTVSSVLVVKGESYFALTSEAIMAGARLEASLTLGPLWAYLRLGADGIVYFDPFHFQVTGFAELGAGITIDIDLGWFGHIRITISVHLHAAVLLEGPEFRGKATIDLDVASATIAFGDWSDRSTPVLDWASFDAKYLQPGGAAMLTATPGNGLLPPSTDSSRKAPTGGPSDPHLLLPEFELTISTTAASSALTANGGVALPRQVFLAIGPMHVGSVTSTRGVSVASSDGTEFAHTLAPAALTGQFPLGVWGPQPLTEPKPVPTGDVVEAGSGIALASEANISVGTVPIDYHQIETGPRHQLPFLAEAAVRGDRAGDVAAAAAAVAAAPNGVTATLDIAREWLTTGAQRHAVSPLAAAVFTGARAAPPQALVVPPRLTRRALALRGTSGRAGFRRLLQSMGALTSRAPFPLTAFALPMQTTAQEGMAARMVLVPSGAAAALPSRRSLSRGAAVSRGLRTDRTRSRKPCRAFRSAGGSNPSPPPKPASGPPRAPPPGGRGLAGPSARRFGFR